MFPEGYPSKSILVEVKSHTLPDRVMKLIESISEKEAKKLQGQHQVIAVCKVVRQFLDENMFIVCAAELDAVRNKLMEEGDDIKIRQKTGSFIVKAYKNGYFMAIKLSISDDYPTLECK